MLSHTHMNAHTFFLTVAVFEISFYPLLSVFPSLSLSLTLIDSIVEEN